MAFPEELRVVYERNPLEEVRSDIRFPTILAIDSASPVEFQETVRVDFPYYELRPPVVVPSTAPRAVSQLVERQLAGMGVKTHVFHSEDRQWSLSLTKDGLTLSCRRYERWEPFRIKLQAAMESLTRVYRPSFLQHTCVRYKNLIRRRLLGLEGTPWANLLQPWVCGPLNTPEADGVEVLTSRHQIRLPDGRGRETEPTAGRIVLPSSYCGRTQGILHTDEDLGANQDKQGRALSLLGENLRGERCLPRGTA